MRSLRETPLVRPADDVADALATGLGVVALESAVITCGLPRTVHAEPFRRAVAAARADGIDLPDLDALAGRPLNLAVAAGMTAAVRHAGAVPAVIAVVGGVLRIGLDADELERLAAHPGAGKVSTATLAAAITPATGDRERHHGATQGLYGTTVAATLAACGLAPGPGIRWFATGGIGGVHRGWTRRPDISADLGMLAGRGTSVVCAGAKSILDVPATLEVLESLGVPVVGVGTDVFPRFHALGDPADRLAIRRDDPDAIAALAARHAEVLGRPAGLLVVRPVPAAAALDPARLDADVAAVDEQADAAGVTGAARTPWLLDALARATDGRSLDANVALLLANAALAADIAAADAAAPRFTGGPTGHPTLASSVRASADAGRDEAVPGEMSA